MSLKKAEDNIRNEVRGKLWRGMPGALCIGREGLRLGPLSRRGGMFENVCGGGGSGGKRGLLGSHASRRLEAEGRPWIDPLAERFCGD